MSQNNVVYVNKGSGMVAGIIACVLAVLGILFFAIIFVPLAAIVAVFGTIISIKNGNAAGIGVNVLAWVLVIVGIFTSPVILAIIGYSAS